jgi:hypothetical protein
VIRERIPYVIVQMTTDFSSEPMKARRKCQYFSGHERKNLPTQTPLPVENFY